MTSSSWTRSLLDLTASGVASAAPQADYATGSWGDESRDYHLCRPGAPRAPSVTRCWRPGVAAGGRGGGGQALVRAVWTDDVARSTRINRRVAEAMGEDELADVIQEGMDAHRSGDVDRATEPVRSGRPRWRRRPATTTAVERLAAAGRDRGCRDRAGPPEGQGRRDRRHDRGDPVHPHGADTPVNADLSQLQARGAVEGSGRLLPGAGLLLGGRRTRHPSEEEQTPSASVPTAVVDGPNCAVRLLRAGVDAEGTWNCPTDRPTRELAADRPDRRLRPVSAGDGAHRSPQPRSIEPGDRPLRARSRTSACPIGTPCSCASPTGDWALVDQGSTNGTYLNGDDDPRTAQPAASPCVTATRSTSARGRRLTVERVDPPTGRSDEEAPSQDTRTMARGRLGMEIALLGPLELTVRRRGGRLSAAEGAGGPGPPGPPDRRDRSPRGDLEWALWGDEEPRTAEQGAPGLHLGHPRKASARRGHRDDPPGLPPSRPQGRGRHVPVRAPERARGGELLASGHPGAAVAEASRALALWRGDPLPDLADGPVGLDRGGPPRGAAGPPPRRTWSKGGCSSATTGDGGRPAHRGRAEAAAPTTVGPAHARPVPVWSPGGGAPAFQRSVRSSARSTGSSPPPTCWPWSRP